MRRIALLVSLVTVSGTGTLAAQKTADSLPDLEAMPPAFALVRYKPRSDAAGDWMLGSIATVRMRARSCAAVTNHFPDDPLWIVSKADSLEVAWQDGELLRPHSRAQVDSMAVGATWHRVDLAKALEGVPKCVPEFQ